MSTNQNKVRRFTHVDGFSGGRVNYVEYDVATGVGECVYFDGTRSPANSELIFAEGHAACGKWKEIFPTKYFVAQTGLAFGGALQGFYYLTFIENKVTAVNADGSTEPLPGLEKLAASSVWKEVDEATAKAALKPARDAAKPPVRRFGNSEGKLFGYGDLYWLEFEGDTLSYVYENGRRELAGRIAFATWTLAEAEDAVKRGRWTELDKAPAAPACSDFYIVGRKFGPYSCHSNEEAATLAANELAKNEKFPVYLFKPVKSFTLVQSAPIVEEKTL